MKWFLIACLGFLSCYAIAQDQDADLFTNTYVVVPDFLEKIKNTDAAPINVTKHFENQGIPFPAGGVVMYYPSTSQLMVRSAEAEMELVSEFIDTINNQVEKQVYVTLREINIGEEEALEAGFDWMMAPVNPVADEAVTEGKGIIIDSREAFLEEFSRPPTVSKERPGGNRRATSGISGVFTDPQFQVVIRELSQVKGVDLLSAPSVMTRSNQPSLIQVKEKRWGVIPVVGADEFTIDLELYLPRHGEPLFAVDEQPAPSARVTIWDGQTVAWSDRNDDGTYRIVFLKAQMMNPAGIPIHPEPEPAAPASDETIEDLQGSMETYEVQEGDTLARIARQFDTSVKRISDANFLSSNMISVGQKLDIPNP